MKEWMGHEIIDTTEDYVRFAKQYYRNANFDWIKAALKFHGEKDKKPTMEQENGLISKTSLRTLVSNGTNRGRAVCSDGNCTGQQEKFLREVLEI